MHFRADQRGLVSAGRGHDALGCAGGGWETVVVGALIQAKRQQTREKDPILLVKS